MSQSAFILRTLHVTQCLFMSFILKIIKMVKFTRVMWHVFLKVRLASSAQITLYFKGIKKAKQIK
jgi:hypothetical protein